MKTSLRLKRLPQEMQKRSRLAIWLRHWAQTIKAPDLAEASDRPQAVQNALPNPLSWVQLVQVIPTAATLPRYGDCLWA